MKTPQFSPRLLTMAVYAACASLALPGAWAAEVATAVQEQSDKADDKPVKQTLNTVTVTSERTTSFRTKLVQVGAFRDQQMLDVPLTINVMPRALLDAQAAEGLFDAMKNSAGVSRSQTSGSVSDNLSIRGINVDNRTSYRLNGSLPIVNLIDVPLENKERVEALKGSSALYYGFTSPAGIVNLVTKRARKDPNASASLSGNEFGQVIAHADVGRKFGERQQFGVRANLVGGQLRNAIDGVSGNRRFGSVALDWQPSDDLSLRFDIEDIHKKITEQGGIGLLPAVNGVITLPRLPDPTRLLSGSWAPTDARAQNVLLRADYNLSERWAATIELGRAETDRDERTFTQMLSYNVNTGAGNLRSLLTRGQQYINKNARLELAGRLQTGFLDHELSLGLMTNKRFQNGLSGQTVNQAQNLYDPVALAASAFTITPKGNPQNATDNGLYVFDRIRIGSSWQLLAGIRSTDYKAVSNTSTYTVKKTTPSVGVVYRLRPDTSIYANYIEGLEETGTAPATAANAFSVLEPSVSKQKEVGLRSEALAGMTASIAYFEIERASAYLNPANLFVLDGRSHYRGVEFALSGDISKSLAVFLSGMVMDAELRNAANAALLGKTPENTAKSTLSSFIEYRGEWLPDGLSFNGGAFYTAKRPVNNFNQAFIPGYTLFTLGSRYTTRLGGQGLTLQLNVENAGNKRYWSAAGGSLLGQGLARTVKLSAKVEF